MSIAIETGREWIEETYIGFRPNTSRVGPVHIANGLFRGVLGGVADTKTLIRFVFSRNDSGKIPRGHEISAVYGLLRDSGRMDHVEISEASLGRLRELLKMVVGADEAVYTSGMESYSAGFLGFVSNDRIGQSGGELVSEWFRRSASPLWNTIESSLKDGNDTITILANPLLETELRNRDPAFDFHRVNFLNKELPSESTSILTGLLAAANTLSQHLNAHPNKLFRLRLAVLFSSFVLVRHMANLESYYVPRSDRAVIPFLLDFSNKVNNPLANASAMTYTLVCQSVARFYAWGFGKYLHKEKFTMDRLRRVKVPEYKSGHVKKGAGMGDDLIDIWKMALADARGDAKNGFTICGQALYDMLALQANVHPIGYLRQLGHRSGLLYPPVNTRPTKRFRLQQDMLETLLRGAVGPGEVIDMPTLQDRFWDRYGLIIGGRAADEQKLLEHGIYQADGNSLEENRSGFGKALSRLGFANVLADGVLQVNLEVSNED